MIFYFSATGNSKYVATKIAESTGDRIISISECMKQKTFTFSLNHEENFGLVIPTYFGGFPKTVIDFLSKLKISVTEWNYVFFVGTYGSGAGNICKEAEKRLSAFGKTPDATFTIKMVDNWIPYFDMTDKAYIEKAEFEAEPLLTGVIEKVSSRTNELNADKGMPGIVQKISTVYYGMACSTKKFSVSDACIGCGICERQCPTQAIKIKDGKPEWVKKKCTLCLGCVHHCPKNAIAYTKKTKGHGQYYNPNVKPE